MASNQSIIIQPRPNVKKINYISKTFTDFRQNLIEFAKSYYPNTYSDFNESSPGMMFIDMAAYVGDVLSFYIDNQFKENLLAYAEQTENVVTLAQFLGYKPKLTAPATTKATIYQIVPAKLTNGVYSPDPLYLLKVGAGTVFTTNDQTPIEFRLVDDVDFSDITASNYIVNSLAGGLPSTFIVEKEAKLVAAVAKTATFNFGTAQKFTTVTLPNEPIIGVESVVDSDNNEWYEVDYLAQDVVMDDVDVTNNNETGLLPTAKLRLRKVARRFTTRINRNLRVELLFGSGTDEESELNLTLDSRQIANNQYGNVIKNVLGNTSVNNVNFLNNNAYGIAPANTTLTIKYFVGGGTSTNTPSNTIVNVNNPIILNDTTTYSTAELSAFNTAVQSLSVNNEEPATGGSDGETIEEIKQNALGFFNAQNRVVTVDDYIIRAQSLPEKYGRVAKAYAIRDEQINRIQGFSSSERTYVSNPVRPNTINLYTLGYNKSGNLATLNTIVKDNLARYLEQYRLLTDDVNILDAFIINIGVRFEIVVFKNYNMRDVLTRCIGEIQNFFAIEKWSIGQPIILADLRNIINTVDGVKTLKNIEILNKYQFVDGADYQPYRYPINEATIDDVIYPSLDPSIFELKNPQTDIIGTASQ